MGPLSRRLQSAATAQGRPLRRRGRQTIRADVVGVPNAIDKCQRAPRAGGVKGGAAGERSERTLDAAEHGGSIPRRWRRRTSIVADTVEPGVTPWALRSAGGGVAPGSTSRCGPHRRRSVERTNSRDSLECGNDAVPADVTYGGDIATWVSCHLRLVAARVSVARSGSYRRRSACTRSRHGGDAAASTVGTRNARRLNELLVERIDRRREELRAPFAVLPSLLWCHRRV